MIRLRNTDEWVGLLVLVAIVVFMGAVLEAGVLRAWFRPSADLRIVLPQSGLGGLAAGAEVDVLGTTAGTIWRIVINPGGQMYAEAAIDPQTEPFIRRDSRAVIRRPFSLAGAAYVDVSRGTGAPMDWRYAVIEATAEPAPTDMLTAMIGQMQQKLTPLLDDAQRAMDAVVAITAGIQKGNGSIGRLLTDETLAQQAQQAVAALGPMIAKLDDAAKQAEAMVQVAASRKEGLPELLRRVDALLANLQSATREVARAAPQLPAIARNAASSTSNLPALLTQTQAMAAELEQLAAQLRGLWLLGGGRSAPESPRLPASQIRP